MTNKVLLLYKTTDLTHSPAEVNTKHSLLKMICMHHMSRCWLHTCPPDLQDKPRRGHYNTLASITRTKLNVMATIHTGVVPFPDPSLPCSRSLGMRPVGQRGGRIITVPTSSQNFTASSHECLQFLHSMSSLVSDSLYQF